MKRLLLLLTILFFIPSKVDAAWIWTQHSFTTSPALGSSTFTPGGYSSGGVYNNKFYGIDMLSAFSGFPEASIYGNVTWHWDPATNVRTLIDTSSWGFNGSSRTYAVAANASAPTPPNRHFIFAVTNDGVLQTMSGLNNKILVDLAFAPGDVDLATEEITFTGTTPMSDLQQVTFTTTGALPTGLAVATTYYVIYVSTTKLKFASNLANARAGTAVNLNTSTGSGVHTMVKTVAPHPFDYWRKDLTGSPNLWTQIFPARADIPIQSSITHSMTYMTLQQKFMLTPISDNDGGGSARTYLMGKNSPYTIERGSQSYNNGDAPGVNSGNGCAYNERNGKNYCFGGGNGSSPTNDIWEMDSSGLNWTKPSWTGKPRARVWHCVDYIPGATAETDSFVVHGGAANVDGGTKYTDTFLCGIAARDCDSLPIASPPTAANFNYCGWIPNRAELVVHKADGATDEMWSIPMGVAQTAPTVTVDPSNTSAVVPATAGFTVTATGSATLLYQWQKNGSNVAGGSGGTTASYTTPATVIGDHNATFRCIVTNDFGADTSASATLTVTAPPSTGGRLIPSKVNSIFGVGF